METKKHKQKIKIENPSLIESLKGSFKAPKNFDYRKTLIEEITKKHLKQVKHF